MNWSVRGRQLSLWPQSHLLLALHSPVPCSGKERQSTGSRAAYTVPALLPCTPPSLQLLTGTASFSSSSQLQRGGMLAEQLKRKREFSMMSTHCSDGQSCGEPSALPQHYWILPGMGFLFIETLRLNCLVEHLAALSLCFYPEASHASGNLEPVHWLQRDNRFA